MLERATTELPDLFPKKQGMQGGTRGIATRAKAPLTYQKGAVRGDIPSATKQPLNESRD